MQTCRIIKPKGSYPYENEMIAILQAMTKWRLYLVGHRFRILTDHKILKHFLDQRVATLAQ